ncbi:MAG: FGGY family carbohydrate kinase [Bacteroidales bacterium]|nr:FGGY family carbohydrate kinase [Bacteroidales bacterium]
MLFLGIDIGSSSIKVSLFDADQGISMATASYPPDEMQIISKNKDWAEQDPEVWMINLKKAILLLKEGYSGNLHSVGAIGITYQMHGLVALDKSGRLVRNSIIWCDSRATGIGDKAFRDLGEEYCLSHLLNSPGNFTASKLRWVQLYEPENYERINKIMLPGDYIAYRLTGEIYTTSSGLSEGIFWDFEENKLSDKLLHYYDISKLMIPEQVDTFSDQGRLTEEIARELGLKKGIPVAYRAGDQSNNAFSLNILEPGEIAATAGTSGVVYGVTGNKCYDPLSRVNTFLHVNHTSENPRYGVLICLNSTGILNAWAKHQLTGNSLNYEEMNEIASNVPAGAEGLRVFPFGNGAERILQNKNIGASIFRLNINIHHRGHMFRAMQEGIVFAMFYGMEIMAGMGLDKKVIRAGKANMFLSKVFRQSLADISGARIELYKTNGAEGAARGAGLGTGYYSNAREAFRNLEILEVVKPQKNILLIEAYHNWKDILMNLIRSEYYI